MFPTKIDKVIKIVWSRFMKLHPTIKKAEHPSLYYVTTTAHMKLCESLSY